ncbi:hypothetical protein ARMGADRAFT_1134107, partial [Armillaria gallica]
MTIFGGVEFLHRRFIAHWDMTLPNVMLDGGQNHPKGFHPAKTWMNESYTGWAKYITRTECCALVDKASAAQALKSWSQSRLPAHATA